MKVERFLSSGKPRLEPALLFFNQNTFELVCRNEKAGSVDTYVSLFEVKEVRRGKRCTDIEVWLATASQNNKEIDGSQCFSVLFGTGFRLKTLAVAAPTTRDAENWLDGLHYLLENRSTCYLDRLDCWLAKEFDKVSKIPVVKRGRTLALTELKVFVNRINCTSTTTGQGKLSGASSDITFAEFSQLMQKSLYDNQIFRQCIEKYSGIDDSNGIEVGHRVVSLNTFQEFLVREQNEAKPVSEYVQYCNKYVNGTSPFRGPGFHYISYYNFVNYLFSQENQVWDGKKCDVVYQDMSKPLSAYWIASSHNTYLMGDQISSESSVEAYIRCLRQGCRTLELDCWDGPSGMPEIYHGRTLTTKVGLVPVLKTIRDHAFVTSEYPVILSIENHCSLPQQRTMHQKFQEIFGDMLVTKPLFKVETELPSPYALRRRILVKGRTLSSNNTDGTHLPNGDSEEIDKNTNCFQDSFKTGKMYLHGCDQWEPYFFVLTSKKLVYTEIVSFKERDKDDMADTGSYNGVAIQELHPYEIWFHGKIAGGSEHTKNILTRFGVEGGFLVRESEKKPGTFILSFLAKDCYDQYHCEALFKLCFSSLGTAYHLEIATSMDKSMYYFTPSEKFDSLYSLVTHYQEHPLETESFFIRGFTQPVPQHSFTWFYPNALHPEPMSRKRAEKILTKIPLCGAFLVRYASEFLKNQKSANRFVITFRMANRIRHCRIKEEVSLKQRLFFVVATQPQFQGIKQLIDHYSQEQSFYQGRKLKYPLTEDFYNVAHQTHNPDAYKVYTSSIDYELDLCVRVRALHSYKPTKQHMLYFTRGDVIINVVKQEEFWWKGDLEKQIQKYFPANLVEEIEPVDSPFGKLEKGCMELGKVEVEENLGDATFPAVLKLYSPGKQIPHRMAVKSQNEAMEWQAMINWVRNRRASSAPKERTSWLGLNQKKDAIAPEFSKLIVYCSTVSKVCPQQVKKDGRVYKEMVSFSEAAACKKMSVDPEFYVWLNQVQLSRVYPKPQRIDSSNYSPVRFWNHGCQLVALNYQTPDRAMQLNQGKFRDNGRCGYILKPYYMLRKKFNPSSVAELVLNGIPHANFQITIIAGRHLFRSDNKCIQKPVVTIEILGADSDCQKVSTVSKNANNGLNPYWNETFHLKVFNADLALVHFIVQDKDSFGDPYLVAQAAYPLKCLRSGYRSVVLENGYGEQLLSRLLIHLQWACSSGTPKPSHPDWVLLNGRSVANTN